MMRWGNGYHRERRRGLRAESVVVQVLRDIPAAILMTAAVWAFCALAFAVLG